MPLRPGFDVQRFNHFGKENFPGFVGLAITEVAQGLVKGELALRKDLLPPNGYLPAGAIVSTAAEGTLYGEARAVHLGRTTQVWDALVSHGEERRKLALFRCTQLVIYPK